MRKFFIIALAVLAIGIVTAFTADRTSVRQPEYRTVRTAYESQATLIGACQIDRYAIPAKRMRVPRVYR